jgi:class 3 adenylate cyclase
VRHRSGRVCAIAAGGQILVTNKAFATVEDRVTSNTIGDVEFKRLGRPVPIIEITDLR